MQSAERLGFNGERQVLYCAFCVKLLALSFQYYALRLFI